MAKKLKIAINAQIIPSEAGGIAQFILGLVYGLGKLKNNNEEYIIITHPREPDWLNDFLSDNQQVFSPSLTIRDKIIAKINPVKPYLHSILELEKRIKTHMPPKSSNGYWKDLGVDVVHFPYQYMELTNLPTIFNPHDLQHLHFPQFFGKGTRMWRNKFYKIWCQNANFVAAESHFVKNDILNSYKINKNKIAVIPRGVPHEIFGKPPPQLLEKVKKKFNLNENFLFYPAQTYPHKNHINLLKAISNIRTKYNIRFNLVCCGKQNNYWPAIKHKINELDLNRQVRFLGYVKNEEVSALYKLSQFVVFPTLFEGGGFPLLEAMYFNKPIACSDIKPLNEIGEDVALYFNPNFVDSIVDALLKLQTEPKIVETLQKSAAKKIKHFKWEKTAKNYRSLYRFLGNKKVSNKDQARLKSILVNNP